MAETPGRNTDEASRCPPKRETPVAEAADNSRSWSCPVSVDSEGLGFHAASWSLLSKAMGDC